MLSYHKVLLSFYIYLYTSMVRLAPMLLFVCTLYSIGNHMTPHIPSPSPLIVDDLYCEPTLNVTLLDALNIFPIGCLLFLPIIVLLFHHCETFRFVSFPTNLSLQTKRSKQAIFPILLTTDFKFTDNSSKRKQRRLVLSPYHNSRH